MPHLLFMSLFMAVLGLQCSIWAFSIFEQGLFFVALCGTTHFTVVPSLVVEHGFQSMRAKQL